MANRQTKPTTHLSVADISEDLGVSKMTVYRLIQSGELPAIRVRRSFRVEGAVYDAYRQRSAVASVAG